MMSLCTLLLGDCAQQLGSVASDSVDLIFTSPPYADQRKHTYGGVAPDAYVAFPKALPEWFIKLFTQPGDTVLDPFMGSGTTVLVALEMGRTAIGIDIVPEYVDKVRAEVEQFQERLL